MNFKTIQKSKVEEVEGIIKSYLPKEEGYQKTVIEAMNYSILGGGKRLRPLMMQETFQLFGGNNKIIEPFMAAIEMIHTYSLVHDDLPPMDNDEYRRGRKTTHIVYGEAMGILAGDGLLNLAFETALKAFDIEADNVNIYRALQILFKKSGIYGMIGGQTVDIESVKKQVDKDVLDFIYRLKTSALIEASMMVGAILAGASSEEVNLIEEIASDIGLAFQIQDDILDVTSTMEILGKPVNSDNKNEKTTYVTIEGIEKAKDDVNTISDRAINNLNSLSRKNEFLSMLIKDLINREK